MPQKNIKFIAVWLILAVLSGGIIGYILSSTPVSSSVKNKDVNSLNQNLRKSFTESLMWSNNYIVAFVSNSPDAPDTAKKLLQSEENIGNILLPYYGKSVAENFTRLLKEKDNIAANMLMAGRAGDSEKFQIEKENLLKNADDTAGFLNEINPKYFSMQETQALTKEKADFISNLIILRLQNKWSEYAEKLNKAIDKEVSSADKISNGIAREFPELF